MKVPLYPSGNISDNSGKLTNVWVITIDQLLSELRKNFGNQGCVIPSLTDTQITNLSDSINGTLIYDSTNNELLVRKNGVFKTITTS